MLTKMPQKTHSGDRLSASPVLIHYDYRQYAKEYEGALISISCMHKTQDEVHRPHGVPPQ